MNENVEFSIVFGAMGVKHDVAEYFIRNFEESGALSHTAMRRFIEVLPLLAELVELENSVIRLARELRKTQRRCNALSKVLVPDCSETIEYILSSLEERERERERESFIIQKMIKDRLTAQTEGSASNG